MKMYTPEAPLGLLGTKVWKMTTFKKIYFFTSPKIREKKMEAITFANFDYRAQPEDLAKVIELFNNEYDSLIERIDQMKEYIYNKEEMKYTGIVYPEELDDGIYTKWDEICEKGYIDNFDVEDIAETMNNINNNIWEEPNNKYRELKHLKEKMIYVSLHLHL